MKRMLFRLLVIVFLTATFSGCMSRDPQMANTCDQRGTVKDLTGLDGCKWAIEKEDGSRLIPVAADQVKYQWVNGTKINFGFENQNEFNTCMAGQTIHLTCLENIKTNFCNGNAYPSSMVPQDSVIRQPIANIISHSTEKGLLKLNLGYSGCSADRDFTLLISTTAAKSLPPQRAAYIQFNEQACLAYFNREVCFDISSLTEKTILTFEVNGKPLSIEVNP